MSDFQGQGDALFPEVIVVISGVGKVLPSLVTLFVCT